VLFHVTDKIHGINYADHGHINGRVRASHGRHGGKTFGGEEDAVARACVNGVERQYCFTAIAAIEIQRLHEQNLAPYVRGRLLRRDYVTNHPSNQH
jgi:hypothetical protein